MQRNNKRFIDKVKPIARCYYWRPVQPPQQTRQQQQRQQYKSQLQVLYQQQQQQPQQTLFNKN